MEAAQGWEYCSLDLICLEVLPITDKGASCFVSPLEVSALSISGLLTHKLTIYSLAPHIHKLRCALCPIKLTYPKLSCSKVVRLQGLLGLVATGILISASESTLVEWSWETLLKSCA
jgi:hypothetical protein